jgi:thiamine-monophosphate kinase
VLISKLGEFGLIERFRSSIKLDSTVIKGSGDDCAVIEFNRDRYLLFTCDMLVEDVDFLPGENPYLIGRKSLAVSISDIAACAGVPCYCAVSLGLPKNTTIGFADRLFRGMRDSARQFKINIVGGDLSRSKKLSIDVSMLGLVEKKFLVLRSTAKEGDTIFVTGTLGGSIRGKHLRFTPRVRQARFLVENFRVNSMIDISDGLAQDLSHILKASKKGALIYEGQIPLSRRAKGLKDALYSGEDFELLFTMPRKEADRLLRRKISIFRPIGEITAAQAGLRLVDKKGKERNIKPKGFCHF